MKKVRYQNLVRVMIVALLYYIGNRFAEFDFLLDCRVFTAFLVLYFILMIVSSMLSEKISTIIRIVTDVLFIILCGIETCFYEYWMHKTPGEAGFGCWAIMMYSPIFVLFIVYLIKDCGRKRNERNQ